MPLCFKIMLEKEVYAMKKTADKNVKPKVRKNKEIGFKITFSDEPCTEEESIQAMAKLCCMVLEMDRNHHRRKLQEGEQYCFYCKKQITELNDFYSPDGENCCFECAKKLTDDPNRQERFCGFPVVSSKDGSPVTKSSK